MTSLLQFTEGGRAASRWKAGHEKLKIDFDKLSKPNARRLLGFWQVREVSAGSA
jgi:hypothetical protein